MEQALGLWESLRGQSKDDDFLQLQKLKVLAEAANRMLAIGSLNEVPVVLSSDNKSKLLSVGNQAVLLLKDEASSLLARLEQLNPDLRLKFYPKEDALSQLTLRVLCPHEPALGRIPSFIAISYCWHSDAWNPAPAAHPIRPGWEISQGMIDAIMNLRTSPDEGVWLDRLCINQADEAEKEIAIGAMDVVYRSARRLIILLEDIQLNASEQASGQMYARFYKEMADEVRERGLDAPDRFADKIEFANAFFPNREEKLDAGDKHLIRAAAKPFVMKMLSARWYSRAWCSHESRVVRHLKDKANNPVFLCFGSDGRVVSYEFRFLLYLANRLQNAEPEVNLQRLASSVDTDFYAYFNGPNSASLLQRLMRLRSLMPDASPKVSSMQNMMLTSSVHCFLIRDLLSIGLNTSGIPLFFRGDITCKEDIFWIFAALVIASGDISPLRFETRKLKLLDESQKPVISWLCLPIKAHILAYDESLSPSAVSITAVTREYIELDLLVFSSSPVKASERSLQIATSILGNEQVQDAMREIQASEPQEIMDRLANLKNKGPDLMQDFDRNFLALSIDCGIDWIVRLPGDLERQSNSMWFNGTIGHAADVRMTNAALTCFPALILPRKIPKTLQDSISARQSSSSLLLQTPG